MAARIPPDGSPEPLADQKDVEMGQHVERITPLAQEMDLVADEHLVAEAEEPLAVGTVAEDQQMDVVADDLQEIGGPDGVLHPLGFPERPKESDKPAPLAEAEPGKPLGPRAGRRSRGRAVGNHVNLAGRQPAGDPCVAGGRAGDDDGVQRRAIQRSAACPSTVRAGAAPCRPTNRDMPHALAAASPHTLAAGPHAWTRSGRSRAICAAAATSSAGPSPIAARGSLAARPGKRHPEGTRSPFAGTARRVLRTNGDCPLSSPRTHA